MQLSPQVLSPSNRVDVSGSSSHSRKMGPGHVKRPCNAFILFRSHAVTANLIPKEVERDHRNISRIISHMWHSLSEEERKLWEMQAELEKRKHREMHPDYKYRPSSRRNNVHRRAARRLSSTERQCERIADAILKSCGREGIKRQRKPKTPKRKSPMAQVSPCLPSIPGTRSFVPECILPPEHGQSNASRTSNPDVPSQVFDLQKSSSAGVRRSSSAPPFNADAHQLAPKADWTAIPSRQLTLDETMNWLFQASASPASPFFELAPSVHPTPTPSSDISSPVKATWVASPASSGQYDDVQAEQTLQQLESFSLGPSIIPNEVSLPSLTQEALTELPISPKTQLTPSSVTPMDLLNFVSTLSPAVPEGILGNSISPTAQCDTMTPALTVPTAKSETDTPLQAPWSAALYGPNSTLLQ